MDSSQLTNIRKSKVIFADYSLRNAELLDVNSPNYRIIPRPIIGSSPRFSSSSEYRIWKTNIIVGAVNTTPSQLEAILQTEFPVSVPTTSSSTVPDPPLSLCVIPSNNALTIIFIPGSDGGSPITNYSYSTNGITYTPFSPVQTTSPITVSGLTNGTVYTIYLKAVNSVGSSTASSSVTAAPIPSSFDPSSITGLNIWLDAQNTANVVVIEGQVSAWNDESSDGNDFTASTGGVITYDQPSDINARPALNFTTTGTYLSKTFNITPGTNQLTLFMIVNQTGTGTGNSELFFTRDAPTSPAYAYFDLFNNTNPSQTGLLSLNIGNTTQNSTGVDIITTPPTIAIISVVISTTGNVYVNGNTTPVSGATRGGLSLDNALLEWAISGQAFLGNIGEVITYPTALADTDRQKVEGYLAWKWGLQANLPEGHPYKNAPPIGEAPTLIFILGSDNSAYVYYTAGTGTPTNYQYTTDNGITYTDFSPADIVSPVLVPGLTNDSSNTINLRAYNGVGYSSISNGLSITPSNTSVPSEWLLFDPTTYSGSGAVISGGTYTPSLSGTISGSVTWVQGTGISTKVFNFISGYISFPIFNFGTNFTISAWIYPNLKASLNAIIANGPTNPNTPGFKFTWNTYSTDGSSSYKLLFENGSGTDWFLPQTVENVVNLQTWQYVTVIFDQSQNISVFLVNGIPVNVSSITTSPNVVVTGRAFNIGAYGNGGFPMKGELGLLKVFNSCLTASQVLADFNATKSAFGL